MSRVFSTSFVAPSEPYPETQRLSAGWSALPVSAEKISVLKWPALPEGPARFRLTFATDVREEVRFTLAGAVSGKPLGEMDLRYGYVWQVHEISLPAEAVKVIASEGLALHRVQGEKPQWIIWRAPGEAECGLSPHLLVEATAPGTPDTALDVLASFDSIQAFGWLEGCVLDGLLALHHADPHDPRYLQTIDRHLSCFTAPDGSLSYENPRNEPREGMIYGEEGPLPLAIIAQVRPESPWLDVAEAFFQNWTEYLRQDHAPSKRHVGESSYTCAYPLAVLGRVRPGKGWDRYAALHLLRQRDALSGADGLWLRRTKDGSFTEFYNWGRAHAWYLLGLARTLPLISHLPEVDELRAEFLRACTWTASCQREDGLWSVFVHEPDLVADTSGSAGIAAAFAIGCQSGNLDDTFRVRARHALAALNGYLTPDGFLTGAAQSNKGGDALQRGDFRVIAQFAQGLYGQLIAALK